MASFLITYDLHKVRNYNDLYRLLAGWNAVKLSESNWLVSLVGPAKVVRDIVCATVDNDDTVAVLQLEHGADWATSGVVPAASAWLSTYVTPAEKAA